MFTATVWYDYNLNWDADTQYAIEAVKNGVATCIGRGCYCVVYQHVLNPHIVIKEFNADTCLEADGNVAWCVLSALNLWERAPRIHGMAFIEGTLYIMQEKLQHFYCSKGSVEFASMELAMQNLKSYHDDERYATIPSGLKEILPVVVQEWPDLHNGNYMFRKKPVFPACKDDVIIIDPWVHTPWSVRGTVQTMLDDVYNNRKVRVKAYPSFFDMMDAADAGKVENVTPYRGTAEDGVSCLPGPEVCVHFDASLGPVAPLLQVRRNDYRAAATRERECIAAEDVVRMDFTTRRHMDKLGLYYTELSPLDQLRYAAG